MFVRKQITAVVLFTLLCSGCFDSGATEGDPVVDETTVGDVSPPPSLGGLSDGLDVPDTSFHNSATESTIRFADVHDAAKIDFVFDNGAAANRKLMPEATSGGAGWLDFDADTFPDLFFPQGGESWQENWEGQPRDQLYRNLGDGQFQNVTKFSWIVDLAYGHGVSVADFNDDGFDDLYVCNVGEDALYLNLGDGTFENVTADAGITNKLWASSSGWGDLDGDGDLDLYVCNYVDYDPQDPILCVDAKGNHGTCHPNDVDPVPNCCFINLGDGTFSEESDKRGLNGPGSKSLGVVIADFTGDHLLDVYVSNDTTANHLFVNQGDGVFEERGLTLGCAASELGHFQASMGIAAGDYDRNGRTDLYVTHFTKDSNTLYQNLGESGFSDTTRETGLHHITMPLLGFGTVMADFDSNGWQDLLVGNGHIDDWRDLNGDDWYMRPQLFRYDGRQWQECEQGAGPYFSDVYLSRAIATADYDHDGDLDAVILNQNAPVGLLNNESDSGGWLQIRLIGQQSNRHGVGAVVTLQQGDVTQTAELMGGTSYCAAHQPIICFGTGQSIEPCRINVRWPSGRERSYSEFIPNQFITLHERDAESP